SNDWAKHVLWLIDHHPESAVWEIPLPPIALFHRNRPWSPIPEVIYEYRDHWQQTAAAHPQDTVVLHHAALALASIDPNLGLPLARKAVELDPACGLGNKNTDCRGHLGAMYGFAILGLSGSIPDIPIPCLTKSPDADQAAAKLRKEVESLTDPEILVSAGDTMKGYSRFYQQNCGGNAEEAVQFGMKLVRKAVALVPH